MEINETKKTIPYWKNGANISPANSDMHATSRQLTAMPSMTFLHSEDIYTESFLSYNNSIAQ